MGVVHEEGHEGGLIGLESHPECPEARSEQRKVPAKPKGVRPNDRAPLQLDVPGLPHRFKPAQHRSQTNPEAIGKNPHDKKKHRKRPGFVPGLSLREQHYKDQAEDSYQNPAPRAREDVREHKDGKQNQKEDRPSACPRASRQVRPRRLPRAFCLPGLELIKCHGKGEWDDHFKESSVMVPINVRPRGFVEVHTLGVPKNSLPSRQVLNYAAARFEAGEPS